MKFGNYYINQSPKEKSRKFDLFRFSKLKSTTNSFVGRFHSKIETFRRLKSRSESPLSFRASLFERDGMFSRTVCEKFSPKDFPKNHFTRDNFYVFGSNTIRKWSVNQRTISGKNNYLSEHYYCTLRTDGGIGKKTCDDDAHEANGENNNNNSMNRLASVEEFVPSNQYVGSLMRGKKLSDCTLANKSVNNGGGGGGGGRYATSELIQSKPFKRWTMADGGEKDSSAVYGHRTNANLRSSSLKDVLDSMSHLDEDTEFKVLKDYFETNSYSDIVRDTYFKDYLNRKNYNDIIDYINDGSMLTDTSTLRMRNRAPYEDLTAYDINATDASKMGKSKSTGNLYESLSWKSRHSYAIPETNASTLKRQRQPPKYISEPSLSQQQSTAPKERSFCDVRYYGKDGVYRATPSGISSTLPSYRKHNCTGRNHQQHVRNHNEIKQICESFLNDNVMCNKKGGGGGFDTSTLAKQYSERHYKKLISKFIKSKGFSTTEEYVQAKFGSVLDRSIPTYAPHSQKLDLPKTYIDNVQRRYQVTKQHFMAAEQMRQQQTDAQSYHTQQRRLFHSTNDLYSYPQYPPPPPHPHPPPQCSQYYPSQNRSENQKTPRHRSYRTLGSCTGDCGGKLRESYSLPSTLDSTMYYEPTYYGHRYLDSSIANCDILCDCCMADYMKQPVPYRRAYYNVYNDHYNCGNYNRRKSHQQHNNHPTATLCANYVK